jgi:hypothetical protein
MQQKLTGLLLNGIVKDTLLPYKITSDTYNLYGINIDDIILVNKAKKPCQKSINLYINGERILLWFGINKKFSFIGTVVGKLI